MTIQFPGSGDIATTIDNLRALANDLERLTMFQPRVELEGAPTIDNWSQTPRSVGALAGLVEGHPILGHKFVVTSEVFAIDQRRRWARTFSRFYRLGDALASNKEIGQ